MVEVISHARLLRPIGLAILALGLASSFARAAEDGAAGASLVIPQNVPDFPPVDGPLRVSVGLTVIDFARVNTRDESFDLHFFIFARWHDPRLVLKPGDPPRRVRRIKHGSCWSPEYVFLNQLEGGSMINRSDLYIRDDGTIWQRIDFTGRFSSPLDLRRFPFDRQTLRLKFRVRNHDSTEVVLVPEPERNQQIADVFLSDWDIGGTSLRSGENLDHPDGLTFSQLVHETRIARRPIFYVWRVLVPFTLMVVVTWVVFWYDVAGLQPQISTVLAVMISVVVFNFTMDFAQPKSPYLTFVDRHAVAAFLFVFAAMIAVAILHVILLRRGAEATLRWQRHARWAFPVAYLAVLVAEIGMLLLPAAPTA